LPYLDAVRINVVPDQAGLVAALRTKAADMAIIEDAQTAQSLRQEPGVTLDARPSPNYNLLFINTKRKPFDNVKVRQAIAYAIDRKAIIDAVAFGEGEVTGPIAPALANYALPTTQYPLYTRDVAKAKQLLTEAGWTPGPDGVLRNAQGERFTVTIGTTAGNRVREDVEQILQNQWRKVGVELKISNQPARVFFGETTRKRDFEMAMYAWVQSPVADCETLYTSDNIPSAQNAYNGQNFPGFSNAEMDTLCHGVPAELDQAKRVVMLKRTQAILAEELPVLPLYFRVDVTSIRNGLQNWKPTGLGPGGQVTWNASQWAWVQ